MNINNKLLHSRTWKLEQQNIPSFFEEKQKWFNFEVNRFNTNIANISQKQCNYRSFAAIQSNHNRPNNKKKSVKSQKILIYQAKKFRKNSMTSKPTKRKSNRQEKTELGERIMKK